jgi:DnaJ-class molecular chaperone
VLVNIPKKLSNKEKELLKELAEQPNFKSSSNENDKGFFKRFGL